jgi:hypothetical protein
MSERRALEVSIYRLSVFCLGLALASCANSDLSRSKAKTIINKLEEFRPGRDRGDGVRVDAAFIECTHKQGYIAGTNSNNVMSAALPLTAKRVGLFAYVEWRPPSNGGASVKVTREVSEVTGIADVPFASAGAMKEVEFNYSMKYPDELLISLI